MLVNDGKSNYLHIPMIPIIRDSKQMETHIDIIDALPSGKLT